jgi:hypothetical protein
MDKPILVNILYFMARPKVDRDERGVGVRRTTLY